MKSRPFLFKRAFTIIELLVVIVIIGILASVVIVSYSNVSNLSTVASLQSDLTNAKKQLLNFQVQSSTSSFPTAINCSSPSASEICIRPSGSNTFSYNVNNSSNPAIFNLTATNGTTKYWINDNSSSPSTQPNIVTSGLVLHLDAANPSSYNGLGLTWTDISGYNNNATLTNGPIYKSGYGGYIDFDGVNDYAPFSTNGFTFGNSSFTLSAWARTYQLPNFWNWIISYGTGLSSQSRFLGLDDFNRYVFGGYGNDLFSTAPTINSWFNITGVYNGSLASIYINGNLVAGPSAFSWNAVSSNAQLGRQTTGVEYWKGSIAQALVYSRNLNSSEVLQNFNATRSRYGL